MSILTGDNPFGYTSSNQPKTQQDFAYYDVQFDFQESETVLGYDEALIKKDMEEKYGRGCVKSITKIDAASFSGSLQNQADRSLQDNIHLLGGKDPADLEEGWVHDAASKIARKTVKKKEYAAAEKQSKETGDKLKAANTYNVNPRAMKEADKDEEEKFHQNLDKLVHKTFGKSDDEKEKMDEADKKYDAADHYSEPTRTRVKQERDFHKKGGGSDQIHQMAADIMRRKRERQQHEGTDLKNDKNHNGIDDKDENEPKENTVKKTDKMAEGKNDPPFDGPYNKTQRVVKDKSGAKHTPFSRARDLAKKGQKSVQEAGYLDLPKTAAEIKKKYPDTKTDVKNKDSLDLEKVSESKMDLQEGEDKLMYLARIGLMDKNEVLLLKRALQVKRSGTPVARHQRDLLFKLMEKALKLIIGNPHMYNLAKRKVMEEVVDEFDDRELAEWWVAQDIEEACWKGYTQKGMKKKGDRTVPNCVPEETDEEDDELTEYFSCGCELCESVMAEEALQEKGEDSKGHKRSTESGAGLTQKGVDAYKRENPGSNLKTAVTGDVKKGSKAANRRKSFCARSRGWNGERGKAARRRWKC